MLFLWQKMPIALMKQTSEAQFSEGRDEPSPEFLKGRALAMLGRREHSRTELRRRLLDLGGQSEQVDDLLEELVRRRLQSDERFAEVFVRSRAERGYGPVVILADLKSRGLAADEAQGFLSASGYDWSEQAVKARDRRFGASLPKEARDKARQLRFLQYRGFTGAQSGHALRCGAVEEG